MACAVLLLLRRTRPAKLARTLPAAEGSVTRHRVSVWFYWMRGAGTVCLAAFVPVVDSTPRVRVCFPRLGRRV